MRIAGIIAEYDPFHNGHAAHIATTKTTNGGNATHIVAVISGNFTQRGEPALLSKFRRTEMALNCGADLVIELPLPWAMAPAEHFALGAVSLLHALGCVNMLSFGSECGDTTILKTLATLSNHPLYQDALKKALSQGLSYAAAGQQAAEELVGKEKAAVLASPNNTLGIEYIRAMEAQGANWELFTLQRQGVLHGEMVAKDAFASASMLRQMVRDDNLSILDAYMPEPSVSILHNAYVQGEISTKTERLEHALMAKLRCMSATDFSKLPWVSEGLENRLHRASHTATDITALLHAVKTRRYPMARLRRVLWAALLGLTAQDIQGPPPYIRILGMTDKGREILSLSSPTLPILSRASQIDALDKRAQRIFELERKATDIHALSMEKPLPCGTDYTTKLIAK